jgi:hypothetical protein
MPRLLRRTQLESKTKTDTGDERCATEHASRVNALLEGRGSHFQAKPQLVTTS